MLVLKVDNLSVKVANKYLIEGISFEVRAGEILAVIGPNGAGKSTLIKAVLGLIEMTDGQVSLNGRAGYVPQKFEFDRSIPMTVKDLLGLVANKNQKQAELLLKEVEAINLFHQKIGQLSGGEFQRVMIANALAVNPQILFLDEPVTGIDMEGETLFYRLINKLAKEKDIAIVLVSHDINIVYQYADTVICLNQKMMCRGRPDVVLTAKNIAETFGGHKGVYKHH